MTINGKIEVYNRCLDAGHEQLPCPRQLLAHAVQPVAEHQRPRAGRLSRLGELLGGLPGRVDAPLNISGANLSLMDYCTAGPQFASGGFIADSNLPIRHQRLAAAVADPQQPDRRLVERRVEPGVRGGRGRAVGGEFPEPAIHDPRDHACQPREAVPLHRRAGQLQRPCSVGADQHPRHHLGRRHDGGTHDPLSDFFIAKPSDSVQTINSQLARGMNLLFTPGVYNVGKSISVKRADTVVLGLGHATSPRSTARSR